MPKHAQDMSKPNLLNNAEVLNEVRNWIDWRGLHMDGGQLLDTLKCRPCDASHGISNVPRVD